MGNVKLQYQLNLVSLTLKFQQRRELVDLPT